MFSTRLPGLLFRASAAQRVVQAEVERARYRLPLRSVNAVIAALIPLRDKANRAVVKPPDGAEHVSIWWLGMACPALYAAAWLHGGSRTFHVRNHPLGAP